MFCGIDLFRLGHRSMVEPENNIVVTFKSRTSHRHWFIGVMRKDGEGARSIEADAFDS